MPDKSDVITAGQKPKPDQGKDTGAQALRELYVFMGNAYAFLHGASRNDEVGLYTIGTAIKDRLAEIEGTGDRPGLIESLQRMKDRTDEVIDKLKSLNAQDLEKATQGGYSDSQVADGGVSEQEDYQSAEEFFGVEEEEEA